MSAAELEAKLTAIDGSGYRAYKSIAGSYEFDRFTLHVDHVQGDPFATPSRLRVELPAASAGLPADTFATPARAVGLRDFLVRRFDAAARTASRSRGIGKSGLLAIDAPGQEILERTAIQLRPDGAVEVRFVAGLPARGRTILGRQAVEMLCGEVPDLVAAICWPALDARQLRRHVEVAEDARALRAQLRDRGLVGFVADGAVLPRQSGVEAGPLRARPIRFRAPASLRVELEAPHAGRLGGLGVCEGVTLIVGGGYHGKSTLLQALALGVYDHVPGDGREYVVADADAVKIRAEDGRRICGVDLSPFINRLPGKQRTDRFSTDNASGSTSQAAAIGEAIESGARLLLVDEDTSATNFMIRDRRMQELVDREHEPITPFIDRVQQLYEELGISTVLVMGGSGDYLDVADTVIAMREYTAHDVTQEAGRVAAEVPTGRRPERGGVLGRLGGRVVRSESLDPARGKRAVKLSTRRTDEIVFGRSSIDLSAVEQLVDESQLRAIAAAMVWAKRRAIDGRRDLRAVLEQVGECLAERGLDGLTSGRQGDLAAFRRHELAAAISRLRTLQLVS